MGGIEQTFIVYGNVGNMNVYLAVIGTKNTGEVSVVNLSGSLSVEAISPASARNFYITTPEWFIGGIISWGALEITKVS